MELKQLIYFKAVAEHGTMIKAAEVLHITQPGLTRSIKALEEELHIALFERRAGRLYLSEAGAAALKYVNRILTVQEQFVRDMRDRSEKEQQSIRIASCALSPSWLLTTAISSISPNVEITVELVSQDDAQRILHGSDYDLTITTYDVTENDIESVPFLDEHLYAIVPDDSPFSRRKSIRMEELDGQTIHIYNDIGFWHDLCKAKLPNSRFKYYRDQQMLIMMRETVPCYSFVSDISRKNQQKKILGTAIPLSDQDLNVTYYVSILHRKDKPFLSSIYQAVKEIDFSSL